MKKFLGIFAMAGIFICATFTIDRQYYFDENSLDWKYTESQLNVYVSYIVPQSYHYRDSI